MANVAEKNERVKVNRDFSIIVPEGYTYSVGSGENIKILGIPQQLVFFKTEMNDIYIDKYSEDAEFNFEEPFCAPRCFVISANQTGLRLDLSDSKTREKMKELANGLNMMSTEAFTIKETDDILVYYFAAPEGLFPNSFFAIVTSEYIYSGQIWINDVSSNAERDAIAQAWLKTVERYYITDADKIPSLPFVAPTYNDKKRVQMGVLTVAIPDGMMVATDEDDFFVKSQEQNLCLLAADDRNGYGLGRWKKSYMAIRANHVLKNEGVKDIWNRESFEERKTAFLNIVESQDFERLTPLVYTEISDELAAIYFWAKKGDDEIEQWASYFVLFVYKDCLIQVNFYITAMLDTPAMEKAIAEWVATAMPAEKKDMDAYERKLVTASLGATAGQNGRINSITGLQLFSNDVFFFVQGQLQADGLHHKAFGVQINSEQIDSFDQIKNNAWAFGQELRNLINFVDEDDCLLLDAECVHHEFDVMNKLDPPVVNGTKLKVNGVTIGKGLSGAKLFLLAAWHMINIGETEENKYFAVLDNNLFKGIPDAQRYICQLIKRLRLYNDIHGDFEVVFASAMNMMGAMPCNIDGVNPMACVVSMDEPVKVTADEDPYRVVQEKIAEEKANGVWSRWARGQNTDWDFEYEKMVTDAVGLCMGDGEFNMDGDLFFKEPETDEKGRLAPRDVKISAGVRTFIKKVGEISGNISCKDKNFVLTEVMYQTALEKYILTQGGTVRSSTVLATDYIIVGDEGSGDTTKARRAIELNQTRGKNIKALTENQFWQMMADGYKPISTKEQNSDKKPVEANKKPVQAEAEKATALKAKENEKAIEKALKDTKDQHRSAKRRFDDAISEVRMAASSSFNIYDDDVAERALGVIKATALASGEYYAICQALVARLDQDCKWLVTNGVSSAVVQKIANEIVDLNIESNIENNFNGSFEGVYFGDIGNIKFTPTDESKQIEGFWRTKVRTLKKKEEDDAYTAKHRIDAKDIEKHKKYKEATAAVKAAVSSASVEAARKTLVGLNGYLDSNEYVEKCGALITELKVKEAIAENEARRQEAERKKAERAADPKVKRANVVKEGKKLLAKFEKELDEEVKKRVNEVESGCARAVNSKNEEINRKQTEKQSLGFFAFGKKKALGREIKELREAADNLQKEAEAEKQKIAEMTQAAKSKYSDAIDAYIEKRFAMCEVGVKADYKSLGANANLAREIVSVIGDDSLTVSSVWKAKDEWILNHSLQSFSALINSMVDAGILEKKTDRRVSYFFVPEKKLELQEIPKYADTSLPKPPTVDSIFS